MKHVEKPRCTSCKNEANNSKIFPFVIGENNVMRNEMEAILKETFRDLALKIRYEQGLTQSKMSNALVMSERSYEDIERGQSGCGALTIVLLLMKLENPSDFLDKLRVELEYAYEKVGVPV